MDERSGEALKRSGGWMANTYFRREGEKRNAIGATARLSRAFDSEKLR